MKIVHIISSLNIGGAETALYRLIKNDKKNEHMVLCLSRGGYYTNLIIKSGGSVESLNINAFNFFRILKILKIIHTTKPDVIQTWMYHADLIGGVLSRLLNYQNIFWNVRHAKLDRNSSKLLTIWIAKVCALLSNIVPKKIIYNSEGSKIFHESLGYSSNKSVVINNGFNLDEFLPDSKVKKNLRHLYNIGPATRIFLHVARWHEDKDHLTCFKALSKLPNESDRDWKIFFVGTGMSSINLELMNHLQAYNLLNNAILIGERSDISNFYNLADLTILTSRTESFPNVLAESMACSTPCVSSDVGNARNIISKNGWTFRAGDFEQLSIYLNLSLKEMNEIDSWKQKKKDCRDWISKNFSIEKFIYSYNNIWRNT